MITPVGNKVIIEPHAPILENGRIVLLAPVDKNVAKGTVVAVSEDADMPVAVGDVVTYSTVAGSLITEDEKQYVSLTPDDILFIHAPAI